MRARMDVKLEGEDTFLLTYTDTDPERARAVVNRWRQLFMNDAASIAASRWPPPPSQALQREVDALKPELQKAREGGAELQARALRLSSGAARGQPAQPRSDDHGSEHPVDQPRHEPGAPPHPPGAGAVAAPSPRGDAGRPAATTRAPSTPTRTPRCRRSAPSIERVHAERIADEKDLTQKVRRNNPGAGRSRRRDRSHQVVASRGCASGRAMCASASKPPPRTARSWPACSSQYDGIKDKYATALSRLRDAQLALRPRARTGQPALRSGGRRRHSGARRFTEQAAPGFGRAASGAGAGHRLGFALDAGDSDGARARRRPLRGAVDADPGGDPALQLHQNHQRARRRPDQCPRLPSTTRFRAAPPSSTPRPTSRPRPRPSA